METKPPVQIDPELRKKWIAALRSGKYRQGKGKLHEDGRYCCLGVACAVAGISEDVMGDAGKLYTVPALEEVRERLGLYSGAGISESSDDYALVYQNDRKNLTFQEIADLLEIPGLYLKEIPDAN